MVRFSYWFAALSQQAEIFGDWVRRKLVVHCRIKMEAVTDFSLDRKKMKHYSVNYIFILERLAHVNHDWFLETAGNNEWITSESWEIKCIHTDAKNSHPVCTSESLMSSDTKVKSLEYCRNISTFLNVWTTKDLKQWAPLHLNVDFWCLPENKFTCSLWKV